MINELKIAVMLGLVLMICVTGHGQDKDWRPVTNEELQLKAPVVEPDADAEAIFWEVRIDDSKDDLSMRHYVRVKIYTERGREKYSKFDVPFTKDTKIKDLAARVIKGDGSVVEIRKEDVFEREMIRAGGQKIKAKSFAVPNIQPGVIIEYRYREVINDAGADGMQLPFQRDIPIQRLSYYYKPANKLSPSYQPYNFTDTQFVKDKDGYWLAARTDVPSLKEEPRMPPLDTVRAWMLLSGVRVFNLQSYGYTVSITIKESMEPRKYWAGFGLARSGIAKWMNKSDSDVSKAASEIVAGASTDDEKLKRIYDFCQTKINNTWYDTSLTDEQRAKLPKIEVVADVLKRKSAAGGDIDFLFGALAHAVGFETAIAYTGNRSKMLFTPSMTNKNLVRRGAIAVKVGSDWRYFNPGIRFLPYGMLVWYEEANWAIIVGEERYDVKPTPFTDLPASTTSRNAKLTLSEDGTLEGDVTVELNGQQALSYRMENYDETADKQAQSVTDQVKARLSTAEVSRVSIENVTDGSKPLVEKYHVRVPNYAQRTGKRLFMRPSYFEYGVPPEFSSSSRRYDIFFRYPWAENDEVEIAWPAGFELDNADAPADVSDPRKIGDLQVRITVDRSHNILKYSRKFHFGGGGMVLFNAEMYTPLKGLFDAFNTADSHTVTLKQK